MPHILTMAELQTGAPVQKPATISRDEILARLQDRALAIVNVMPVETYRAGHIPESINLPIADIDSKAAQLLSNLSQEVVVYCAGAT
jgi:ArsR family transcriptional regulator